jgi:hypothetical protein
MKNWIWIAALVALVLGCSGKSDAPPTAKVGAGGGDTASTGGRKSTGGSRNGTSTGGSTAGRANAGGTSAQATASTGGQIGTGGVSSLGGGSAGGAQSDLAPVVRITNLTNVTDPNASPVLVDKTVDVICEAVQSSATGSQPVEPGTVTITMTDVNNKPTSVTANTTTIANQYTAQFALASVPSGVVTFGCAASDKSKPSAITGHSPNISTFVDHGPSVKIVKPANSSAYSAHKTMTVQATVVPVPLLPTGDNGANVALVTLQVNNATYTLNPDPSDSTLYTLDVNFADTNLFPPPIPAQMTVTVKATNSRSLPAAVSNSVSNVVYIDSLAPTITIATPAEDAVIGGGRRSITFTVIDNPNGSGVKTDTITVTVGSTTSTFVPPPDPTSTWATPSVGGTPGYSYTFDTSSFPSTVSQITVSIQATDFAGNQSDPKTRLLYLDNEAPFVSLDPPNVRVVHRNGSADNCSVPFDPVGSGATNYQQVITTGGFVRLRAFVWELTNIEPGQTLFLYSGVDATNVFVYASDSGVPILVGKTGGKATDPCVAINPDIKTNASAVKSQLAPILTMSTKAFFSTTDFTTTPNVTGTSSLTGDTYACTNGSANDGAVCNKSSDMSYVMTQPYPGSDSAIYAMNVNTDAASPLCAGNQWSVASTASPLLKEGWVCFAAEAADNIGNTGVSAPIPVCLNPSGTANCQPSAMPSCVQSCVPPSRGLYGDDSSGNPLPFPIRYTYTPPGW